MKTGHKDLLPRYQYLRQVAMQLNQRLVKALPKGVLEEGGKLLGILEGKTFMLQSEDVLTILMDFCLYDIRREGINAIERYLAESPPPPGSDEMLVLQAMRAPGIPCSSWNRRNQGWACR